MDISIDCASIDNMVTCSQGIQIAMNDVDTADIDTIINEYWGNYHEGNTEAFLDDVGSRFTNALSTHFEEKLCEDFTDEDCIQQVLDSGGVSRFMAALTSGQIEDAIEHIGEERFKEYFGIKLTIYHKEDNDEQDDTEETEPTNLKTGFATGSGSTTAPF